MSGAGSPVDGAALVPEGLRRLVGDRPADHVEPGAWYAVSGPDWLARLPGLLTALLDEWSLVVDGAPRHGVCAVAVPVRAAQDGGAAVLKVSWPHAEASAEHVALQAWGGHGAVRLLRSDPRRFALLLERLDATRDLLLEPVDEACEVVGDLLARLRLPATSRVGSLADYQARQAEQPDPPPDAMPRRFAQQGRRLREELLAGAGSHADGDGWLLHTDLHYENVLAGRREPWLAIDPKPLRGDRAYEVTPLLWNRYPELGAGSAMRWSVRRRIELACAAAGIDPDRARAWSIVREVDNARWAARDGDVDGLTRHIALLKALNE